MGYNLQKYNYKGDDNTNALIHNKLKVIFEEKGIYIESDDAEISLDSLQFAVIIIEMEECFLVRLSNDMEDFGNLKTFNDYYNLISKYFDM